VDRILSRQRQHADNASRVPHLVGLSAMRMIRKVETGALAVPSRAQRRRVIAQWARSAAGAYLQAGMYAKAAGCLRKSCVAFDAKSIARLLWNHLKTEPAVRFAARTVGLLRRS